MYAAGDTVYGGYPSGGRSVSGNVVSLTCGQYICVAIKDDDTAEVLVVCVVVIRRLGIAVHVDWFCFDLCFDLCLCVVCVLVLCCLFTCAVVDRFSRNLLCVFVSKGKKK